MRSVLWTPAAEEDLEEVFRYIGRQGRSPKNAATVVRRIVDECDRYAESPELAPLRPDLGPRVRAFIVSGYIVIYESNERGITILRVIHGARDVPRVFRPS